MPQFRQAPGEECPWAWFAHSGRILLRRTEKPCRNPTFNHGEPYARSASFGQSRHTISGTRYWIYLYPDALQVFRYLERPRALLLLFGYITR